MSLKVITTIVPGGSFPFKREGDIYVAERDFSFITHCKIDERLGDLYFNIFANCKYNGASNPINWPIKNYYGESKKDCCGLGHDLLYAWGGKIKNLDRELKAGEADDYIRGAMREAGFTRKEAGLVDRMVRMFAHHGHYGIKHDKEEMHLNSEIVWVPMNENNLIH